MTVSSLVSASAARRLRAASPGVHGGASSMLRLARGSDARLPSGAALSDWAERAAGMLDLTPMMVGPLSQPVRVAAPPPDLPTAAQRGGAGMILTPSPLQRPALAGTVVRPAAAQRPAGPVARGRCRLGRCCRRRNARRSSCAWTCSRARAENRGPEFRACPAQRSGSAVRPDHLLLHADPAFVVRREDILDLVALDLHGRREDVVFHAPGLGGDDQAVQLLVRVELRVDALQVLGQRGLERRSGRRCPWPWRRRRG